MASSDLPTRFHQDPAQLVHDAYVALLTAMRPLVGRGLSAAVYTQTTDVEIEVNGLMTYDREVVKMDLRAGLQAAAESCKFGTANDLGRCSVQRKITANLALHDGRSRTPIGLIRGSTTVNGKPARPASASRDGPARCCARSGTRPIFGCVARSMRRRWPAGSKLALIIHHDDDAEVYLNGTSSRSSSSTRITINWRVWMTMHVGY